MTDQYKVWTRLGLGTATAIGVMGVGCSAGDEAEVPLADPPVADVPAIAVAPVAASGEGEGGVTIAQAATDPVVFLSALAITEAHVIAARDAYALGETDAAAEMFAHPVSEVLADMQPVFESRGVADFSNLLLEASDAVYAAEPAERIAERTAAIIAALRAANSYAPDDGRGESAIWAGVAADQIDRAADMYAIALEAATYEPYLDGYGFLKAAEAAFSEHGSAIETEQPRAAAAIINALDKLKQAYPSALRPDVMTENPAALKAASSAVQLSFTDD